MRELESIEAKVAPHETLLVADAMTGQEAVRVAEGFRQHVPLSGVILTKLDSDARGGAALSLREVTGVPIKYVGTGEKLDALEQFHPDRLAQRILGMGDVLSLIERAQEHVDQEQAARMQSKVVKGEFDLQDFLDQMSQLRKMAGGGGLTGLVELLPGVGRALKEARQAGQSVDEKQFKRIEAMIDDYRGASAARDHRWLTQAAHRQWLGHHGGRDQSAAGAVPPDAGVDEAALEGHAWNARPGSARRRWRAGRRYAKPARTGQPRDCGAAARFHRQRRAEQPPAPQGAQEEEASLSFSGSTGARERALPKSQHPPHMLARPILVTVRGRSRDEEANGSLVSRIF